MQNDVVNIMYRVWSECFVVFAFSRLGLTKKHGDPSCIIICATPCAINV